MLTVDDRSTASPFYTLSPTLPPGVFLVGPQNLPGIPHAKNRAPFHTVSASSHGPRPLVGVHRVRRREPQRIIMHAGGLAKNCNPFHLATLALIQPPGLQQAGGRVHQGIARYGRLAKNRAPHLIRRNEPSTAALPSNMILRFEKASHTYHFHSPKMSRTRCVALL